MPENGSVQDFSAGPVTYTVTSEDGQWNRTYMVSVNKVATITETEIAIDFENYELEPEKKKYYIWHNVLGDGSLGNDWATGNPGFRISMSRPFRRCSRRRRRETSPGVRKPGRWS